MQTEILCDLLHSKCFDELFHGKFSLLHFSTYFTTTISDNNEKLVLVKQKTFASHMTSEGFFFNTYIISER